MLRKIKYSVQFYSLLVFQFLDGICTFIGVSKWGLRAEGNPLLKYWMSEYGVAESLIAVKLLSIVFIYILSTRKESYVGSMLSFVCGIYLVVVYYWVMALLLSH